jgi:ATP-dependent Clp protease ATP-binding subunit ClpC
MPLPVTLEELRQTRDECRNKKLEAAGNQRFELAASMRDEERRLGTRYDSLLAKWKSERGLKESDVTVDDVRLVVSRLAKIPVDFLSRDSGQRLSNLRENLRKAVVGQDDAIDALDRAIRRSQAQIRDPNRPIGSFLFLGPTGVGKTLLAKQLAEHVFGNEDNIIRVDMSEYMEKFSSTRLIGSPPGYVGHGEGGQLTERIRRKPHSVVLFDEIEKAHPEMMQLLLQVLEDGKLTDSVGRSISFRNSIIIMTSNIGAELFIKNQTVGFGRHGGASVDFAATKEKALEELRHAFRPEFLNRFTEVIVFRPLGRKEMETILAIELDRLRTRMVDSGCTLAIDDGAKEFLIDEGFDCKHGARGLRRIIELMVEDQIAEKLLSGESCCQFCIALDGGKISLRLTRKKRSIGSRELLVTQGA